MGLLLDVIAKPTLILMSAAVLAMLLCRSSASLRHAIWVLALVSATLLPLAAVMMPQLEWSSVSLGRTSVTLSHAENVQASPSMSELGTGAATAYAPGIRWFQPVFVWPLGVAVLLLRIVMGTLAVRRIERDVAPATHGTWFSTIKELSVALGIKKPVRLLFSEKQVSPMTWGLMRHTILWPAASVAWSDERRRIVLAHELAHLKRKDGLTQIFVQIVCSIYWFNPLVWYAANRLRVERERACDDHVLRLGIAASDYADHLIQIVRGLRVQGPCPIAAVSMVQASQLETRLLSILDSRVHRQAISKTGTLLLCAFAGALTASMAVIGVAAAVPMPPVFIAKAAATPQRTRIGNAPTVPNNAVVPPRVMESKPPIYTDEALRENIEGTVTLAAAVDVEGKIKILRVVKELGYGLDQRAIGAVLDWKFAAATRNGVPVESVTQIDVDFKIPVRFDPKDGSRVVAFNRGAGVNPPIVISRVEPWYTPEARAAKYQGSVLLSATVHRDGTLTVDRVVQELSFGLTQQAIDAFEQWKFRPATRNGESVAVSLAVQVNFTLTGKRDFYQRSMGHWVIDVSVP